MDLPDDKKVYVKKVLAEKDPIAMELLKKYNNLPMPNMRLDSTEIKALLTYIEEESARQENPQLRRPAGHISH